MKSPREIIIKAIAEVIVEMEEDGRVDHQQTELEAIQEGEE